MPAAGLIFLILNTGKICNCYYHKEIFKINMTSIKILFLSVLFTLFFSGCNDQKNEKPKTENEGNKISDSLYEDFTVEQSYNFLKSNLNNENVELLDVRTNGEYQGSHISRSKLIDFNSLDFKDKLQYLVKNKTYIVYCRIGRRSGIAVKLMRELGFKEVHNITGGFSEWEAKDLPLDFSK